MHFHLYYITAITFLTTKCSGKNAQKNSKNFIEDNDFSKLFSFLRKQIAIYSVLRYNRRRNKEREFTMVTYAVQPLTPHITQLTDPAGVHMFLAVGTKQAVLVDTGVGFYGLREALAGLTTLPISVILTHFHGDHTGGSALFDRVYLHSADIPMASDFTVQMRKTYTESYAPPNTFIQPEEYVPQYQGAYLPLADGQCFELGGITLQIIHVPGHSPGSCCVLFREDRTILFGDACNSNTLLLWGGSISSYRSSLEHLKQFEDSFDMVLYSHGACAVGPRQTLDDNIELCDRILRGEDSKLPCSFMGTNGLRAAAVGPGLLRTDGKHGNIVYREEFRR